MPRRRVERRLQLGQPSQRNQRFNLAEPTHAAQIFIPRLLVKVDWFQEADSYRRLTATDCPLAIAAHFGHEATLGKLLKFGFANYQQGMLSLRVGNERWAQTHFAKLTEGSPEASQARFALAVTRLRVLDEN